MKSLKIEKGWFFGAGSPKIYNWKKDGYETFGIGISLEFLYKTEEVEITVDNLPYHLKTQDAIDFAWKYNSVENRNGTNIIIISKSLLTPIEVLPVITIKD